MYRLSRILAAASATLAVIGAGAVTASAHSAQGASVKVASVKISGKGKHPLLVTSSGHAVYMLNGDSKSHPLCTGQSCLAQWPAVTSGKGKPSLGKGVTGKLTVWTHAGIHQLVLNGHPLYTFVGDSAAGSANGEGLKSFGGTWWLLSGDGSAYAGKSKSGGSSSGGGW
jgi:predicted lipoprotein with Yx(FWY)xxD motif